ncbi:MAG: uroporphyrinogen-III C-methyltransferase [Verrucomicrobiota bacterium]|nr:uroporphyrinogen-III C-methyltransferase [Verrucomicrobiota bacterium]
MLTPHHTSPPEAEPIRSGTVYLVGAGPGHPDLVTRKAYRLIEQCDALVYDHLACPDALHWTRPTCAQYYVGKRAGAHSVPQEEIENLLVKLAREGKSVVRLKGGDPFIFGRGGEEAMRLREAGIAYEVVPAVTAALAAAAYAGIPLTHRSHSSALILLSGHEDPAKLERAIEWRVYAKLNATLCLYMAMTRLEYITSELLAGGMLPETPVAVVQNASYPEQRTCVTTVVKLVAEVKEHGLCAPAMVIIGPVASYAESLAWFEI